MKQIKAVVFDAFGTICEITEPSDVYPRFFAHLVHERYRKELREHAMTQNISLGELYRTITGNGLGYGGHTYEHELMEEVGSVRPIHGMHLNMMTFRQLGIKTAICSNLAAPFGIPVKVLFSDVTDALFLSYEMGTYKPMDDMYRQVLEHFDEVYKIQPDEILFIGDKDRNDFEAPARHGMQALCVADWKTQAGPHAHFALPVFNYVWSHNQKVKKSQA